ncbi:MAG: hypothetical protein K2M59_07275 [Muribaculaceae bacterium]|nr:hypothetical protein [Muribaculaceae bacterium]
MKRILTGLIMLVIVGMAMESKERNPMSSIYTGHLNLSVEDSINKALDYQIKNYPVSQYRDVYKNFMQDFYGPGHLLTDTAASGRYLRKELEEGAPFDGPLYEPTGYKGNFMRVNLGLIADGTIPYDLFFRTFVESIQGIQPPEDSEWMRTWEKIDSVLTVRNLSFQNEEEDRKALSAQFAEGDYVVHHSQRYNDSVRFHYRIISTPLFHSRILPLIKKP